MNGFIDLHTHILPCVDDGAQSVDQALELLRLAWQNGTRSLLLTPHYRGKFKAHTPGDLRRTFASFSTLAQQHLPGMKLFLGSEIYCESAVPELLAEGRVLSLNDSHYALLEFRPSSVRSQVTAGVSETVLSGFTPIIAHAERYEIFRKDDSLLDEVLEMGALIQLNADSVLGRQGLQIRSYCHKLLKRQLAHFIASDAHDVQHRPPTLRECFLHVHKKYGSDYAAQVFSENAQAVLDNMIL